MDVLRTTEPLHVGDTVLVPVFRVRLEPVSGWGAVGLCASVEPRRVLVNDGEGWRAIDLFVGPDSGSERQLRPDPQLPGARVHEAADRHVEGADAQEDRRRTVGLPPPPSTP